MTTVSIDIAAPAEQVWALVSDLTRMGEWSPETTNVEWTGGATGPALGATFKGTNRQGVRRWSTSCRITAFDPPSVLAWDERNSVAKLLGNLATGVNDRSDHNAAGMRATLERIKAAAEPVSR
jgi:uncharacterized protein YndB with AHSA1/START domain